jgi:hypothetical protein
MGILGEKFRRDLELRGMRPNTVAAYARCCRRFAAHFMRSPLDLSVADVRAYLEHLRVRERKAARTINVYAAALGVLFGETLGRRDEIGRIPRLRVHAELPTILSGTEVDRVLGALANERQRAVVMVMQGGRGCGSPRPARCASTTSTASACSSASGAARADVHASCPSVRGCSRSYGRTTAATAPRALSCSRAVTATASSRAPP